MADTDFTQSTGATYDGSLVLSESFKPTTAPYQEPDFHGEYVADAFVVYDCYSGKRMGRTPVLLRLEDFDLVISKTGPANASLWAGAVDTDCGITLDGFKHNESTPFDPNSPPAPDTCLIWKRSDKLAHLIGKQLLDLRVDVTHGSSHAEPLLRVRIETCEDDSESIDL